MFQALERHPHGETLTVLRESSGLGIKARGVLEEMVDRGQAVEVRVEKPAGRSTRLHDGYRLARPVADLELDGAETGPTDEGEEQS